MRKHTAVVLIALVFLIGLSILLYPTVSSYINERNHSRVIAEYDAALAGMDDETTNALLEAAREYNRILRTKPNRFHFTDEDREIYYGLLNVSGNGIMGHIEIKSIGVKLPVYHGTTERVLQIGVGHFEGTSLPVGGPGTHTVLTAHTGLPSATLFNDLVKLEPGDTFVLRILDEELTYEVDQILVVEPNDSSSLAIYEDEDYCTLLTCTPYGINSHRLLVRGTRIPDAEPAAIGFITDRFTAVGIGLIIFLLIMLLLFFILIPEDEEEKRKRHLRGWE
jgi:sortase A